MVIIAIVSAYFFDADPFASTTTSQLYAGQSNFISSATALNILALLICHFLYAHSIQILVI